MTEEPTYDDVEVTDELVAALAEAMDSDAPPFEIAPRVIGGRYGLSSKDFDPAMGQPFEPHEFRLQRLIMDRANLEREILDAIIMARQKGMTWRKIGEMLGVSAQAAHQQYGALIIAN